MWRWIKRIVAFVLLAVVVVVGGSVALHWDQVQRLFLGGLKVYEITPPPIPAQIGHPSILVFSKTNAFRHEDAIPAANKLFADMASRNGWGVFETENGATFRPDILSRFDAVVFNNVSGDVFTPEQREAFKAFIENGGGFVGIHAAGDDSHKAWAWYTREVIGANFIAHTLKPQFQEATVHVEDAAHPATKGLPASWRRTEEWYSFDASPRAHGFNVLIDVDEKTYKPIGMFGKDLRMGDHPVAWWRCLGKGRVFYTAFGHRREAYSEPQFKTLLENATGWALKQTGSQCGAPAGAGEVK